MKRIVIVMVWVVAVWSAAGAVEAAQAGGCTGNVALNRPVQISSDQGRSDPAASVDGRRSGTWAFHTNLEPNPWWQIDLQQTCPIQEVHIYNRVDCCPERARTIQVFFSTDGVTWQLVHAQNQPFAAGAPLRVQAGGRPARYVRLQLAETNYLHLDEVEIYADGGGGLGGGGVSSPMPPGGGTPGPRYPGAPASGGIGGGNADCRYNLGLNRPARISSDEGRSVPGQAVDGERTGGWAFHTTKEPGAWWEVDLQRTCVISEVRIYNRTDCCQERARTIQVLLSPDGVRWQPVYAHDGSPLPTPLVAPARNTPARFVRLQLAESNYLHLEEVEIVGPDTPSMLGGAPGPGSGMPQPFPGGGTPAGRPAGGSGGSSPPTGSIPVTGVAGQCRVQWIGKDADVVGSGANRNPDGSPDGHVRVSMDFGDGRELNTVILEDPQSRHQWMPDLDADLPGLWQLAVSSSGQRLSAGTNGSLGRMTGRVDLELHAADAGTFVSGRTVRVYVMTSAGTCVAQAKIY